MTAPDPQELKCPGHGVLDCRCLLAKSLRQIEDLRRQVKAHQKEESILIAEKKSKIEECKVYKETLEIIMGLTPKGESVIRADYHALFWNIVKIVMASLAKYPEPSSRSQGFLIKCPPFGLSEHGVGCCCGSHHSKGQEKG